MTLIDLIRSFASAEATSGNWSAVAAKLNAATIDVRDATRRTNDWVMQTFTDVLNPATGATSADLILGTLQAATIPRVKAAYELMNAEGLPFDGDQVQSMLPQLAAAAKWPASVLTRLLEAGRRKVSPAADAGLDTVTSEQCRVTWEAERLQARLVNAFALANERLPGVAAADQSAAWAKCWADAGA